MAITAASGIFSGSVAPLVAMPAPFSSAMSVSAAAIVSCEMPILATLTSSPERVFTPLFPHLVPTVMVPNGACSFHSDAESRLFREHKRFSASAPAATDREYCWHENGFSAATILSRSFVDIIRGAWYFSSASCASRARAFASAVAFSNFVRARSQCCSLTVDIQTISPVAITPITKLASKANRLTVLAMMQKPSVDFGGYWQRHIR
jgi:hypothetical protein